MAIFSGVGSNDKSSSGYSYNDNSFFTMAEWCCLWTDFCRNGCFDKQYFTNDYTVGNYWICFEANSRASSDVFKICKKNFDYKRIMVCIISNEFII